MIGRSEEIKKLNELYQNNEAQFIAIYGRRRVGKTFLVDQNFQGKITFRHAGLSPIEMEEENNDKPLKKQLQHFRNSLLLAGAKITHCPKDWLEAFFMLEEHLQSIDDGAQQLIFLDELPWLDTPKSGFITALEAFWNSWGCNRNNLKVIVCGSAISWMRDRLINNHGGLYGRITYEMKLQPFTLKECKDFLESKNIYLSDYDIVQTYMITGGIPFYLNYFVNGSSLPQNIDRLFFKKNAPLIGEYNRLFSSIFNNPEQIKSIVLALSTRNGGLTRNEIIKKAKCPNGGGLTKSLDALMASDFIMEYVPFGCSKRQVHYKLIDPFCIFYLKFVNNHKSLNEQFWLENCESHSVVSWRGFAFENVCFNHIHQIKKALGISGISTQQSAWIYKDQENDGAQIDLIIERSDNFVNLCEIKFYSNDFTVTKEYDRIMRNKKEALQSVISKKKSVHNVLITTYGITENAYRWQFENVITLEDLMEE